MRGIGGASHRRGWPRSSVSSQACKLCLRVHQQRRPPGCRWLSVARRSLVCGRCNDAVVVGIVDGVVPQPGADDEIAAGVSAAVFEAMRHWAHRRASRRHRRGEGPFRRLRSGSACPRQYRTTRPRARASGGRTSGCRAAALQMAPNCVSPPASPSVTWRTGRGTAEIGMDIAARFPRRALARGASAGCRRRASPGREDRAVRREVAFAQDRAVSLDQRPAIASLTCLRPLSG